jgi:hypothetical protein
LIKITDREQDWFAWREPAVANEFTRQVICIHSQTLAHRTG